MGAGLVWRGRVVSASAVRGETERARRPETTGPFTEAAVISR